MGYIKRNKTAYGNNANNADNITYNENGIVTSVKKILDKIRNKIGNTDIDTIGDGTLTGAIDTHNSAINNLKSNVSHVGMIIHSTTLNTMEKVTAVYGGTAWIQIQGRFLLGASSGYPNRGVGGEATHKLTVSELPSHTHQINREYINVTSGATSNLSISGSASQATSGATGGNVAHNNMPPYYTVYIWERTA